MTKIDTGIASIGLHLPPLAMPVEELASLRGVDPDKYRIGLGCSEISLCPPEFSIVDLASEAAPARPFPLGRRPGRHRHDRRRHGDRGRHEPAPLRLRGRRTRPGREHPLLRSQACLLRRHPGPASGLRVAHVGRGPGEGCPGGRRRHRALRTGRSGRTDPGRRGRGLRRRPARNRTGGSRHPRLERAGLRLLPPGGRVLSHGRRQAESRVLQEGGRGVLQRARRRSEPRRSDGTVLRDLFPRPVPEDGQEGLPPRR